MRFYFIVLTIFGILFSVHGQTLTTQSETEIISAMTQEYTSYLLYKGISEQLEDPLFMSFAQEKQWNMRRLGSLASRFGLTIPEKPTAETPEIADIQAGFAYILRREGASAQAYQNASSKVAADTVVKNVFYRLHDDIRYSLIPSLQYMQALVERNNGKLPSMASMDGMYIESWSAPFGRKSFSGRMYMEDDDHSYGRKNSSPKKSSRRRR